MSSVVVTKQDAGTAFDVTKRVDGMVEAGFEINEWMKKVSLPDKDKFFDDLYKKLTQGGPGTQCTLFYFDLDGNPQELLEPVKKKLNKYRYDSGGQKYFVRIVVEEDEESESRMTVVIPRDRGDLLAGGYVTQIVDDFEQMIGPRNGNPFQFTNAEKDDIKKYLLA